MTDVLTAAPQAGWYDDPLSGDRYRWWDGQTWTGKVSTKYIEPVAPVEAVATAETYAEPASPEQTHVASEAVEPESAPVAVDAAEPTTETEPASADPVFQEPVFQEPAVAETDDRSEDFAAFESDNLGAEPVDEPSFETLSDAPLYVAPAFAMPTPRAEDDIVEPLVEPVAATPVDGAAAEAVLDWNDFDRAVANATLADTIIETPADEQQIVEQPIEQDIVESDVVEAPTSAPDFSSFIEPTVSPVADVDHAYFAEPTETAESTPPADTTEFAEPIPFADPTEFADDSVDETLVAEPARATDAVSAAGPADPVSATAPSAAANLLAVTPVIGTLIALGSVALTLMAGLPSWLPTVSSMITIALIVVGVLGDHRSLAAAGIAKRPMPLLVLLTPVAYLAVRASVVGKQGKRAVLPLVVSIVAILASIGLIIGANLMVAPNPTTLDSAATLLQSSLSTADAPVIVDCEQVSVVIPGVPFDCISYPLGGGTKTVSATVDFAGTVTAD